MLSHKCDSDIGLWLSIFLFTCRYQSWTAGTSSEGSRCNSRAPGKCQMGFGWNTMLILFETLLPMSRSSQLWQSKHICCVYMTLFNCPNWQPLSLFIGSLHWLSSWRWWPSIGGGEDCISHSGGQKWAIWPIFFANLTNYISPDGEFCFCHLVFGVFRPQIHVFWGPIHEFPKMMATHRKWPSFSEFRDFLTIGPQNTCIWGQNTPNTRWQQQNSPSRDM